MRYFLILLLISACTPLEHFQKTVTLNSVKVHIVSDQSQYAHPEFKDKSDIQGYATLKKGQMDIWVIGDKEPDGRILIRSNAVIGEELVHLLNFKDKQIVNPDEYICFTARLSSLF